MLNLKYRKSGKIFIWKPEFYLSIANTTIQDQMWPDQVWPDQVWPDQVCLYRIICVFTGSSVTGSSVTGSSVTGSSMPLQDHMCLYRIKCALHRIWSTALLFWFTTLPFVCIRLCSNFVCIMATSRKKSEVWEHFTEEPGTSFALCRVCHGFDGHNNNCLKLRR